MFIKKRAAPELVGIEDPKKWINSPPVSLEKLKGNIILLDFWAYSCVNCIRTIPALKEIAGKYKNKRFALVGIHTPEFEFEKEIGNVKNAVKKHEIKYPIFNDQERKNWENYGNKYWPRAAVINAEGEVIFEHIGESGYDEIEERIVDELTAIKEVKPGETKMLFEGERFFHEGISRETYAGSARSYGFNSRMVCTPDGCNEYIDSGKYEKDTVNLHGQWIQEKEYVEFQAEKGGWIALKFFASEVNVVMSGIGIAEILLDGNALTRTNTGKDVMFIGKKSYVKLNGADMYRIFDNRGQFREGILKIIPFRRMRVFAYTFG